MKIDIQKITSLEPGKIYAVEIAKNQSGILTISRLKALSNDLNIKFIVYIKDSVKFTEVPEGMGLLKRIEALEKKVDNIIGPDEMNKNYTWFEGKTCSAPGTTTQEIEQLKARLKPKTMPKDKENFDKAFPDKGKLRDLDLYEVDPKKIYPKHIAKKVSKSTLYFKKKRRKHR